MDSMRLRGHLEFVASAMREGPAGTVVEFGTAGSQATRYAERCILRLVRMLRREGLGVSVDVYISDGDGSVYVTREPVGDINTSIVWDWPSDDVESFPLRGHF